MMDVLGDDFIKTELGGVLEYLLEGLEGGNDPRSHNGSCEKKDLVKLAMTLESASDSIDW